MQKQKSSASGDETVTVRLIISAMGKKAEVEVPKGTKLSDALREAGITDVSNWSVRRLNLKPLGEDEDPILGEDSSLILTQKPRGG